MIYKQFSFLSQDIYEIIVLYVPEIYVKDCKTVIKRVRDEMSELENELKEKRRKVEMYESSLKNFCPHRELHQEICFDGHKNKRYHTCISCNSALSISDLSEIDKYEIVSYSRF